MGAALGGIATPKLRIDGTFRSRPPGETLAVIRPHMQSMGITRVANVTGLDRVGIPVFMVIRPNGRGLAVSQGKGVDETCARVSGIMESIEAHHAEYTTCNVIRASYESLGAQSLEVIDPLTLPLSRDSRYRPDFPIGWTEGSDLFTRRPTWVPYELVNADFSYEPSRRAECFLHSTNGLASGNSLAEAALHALCELVERDALAVWEAKHSEAEASDPVELSSIDDPVCVDLLRRFDRADIGVLVWDVTSDVGIAVFRAVIFDRAADGMLYPMAAAAGSGCHPAREIALSRALTEAAQSRLTFISGSRDDRTRSVRSLSVKAVERYDRLSRVEGTRVPFRATPTFSGDTIEADLDHVLEHVRRVGADRVVLVDLSRPGLPISVVRVIASTLEGVNESRAYCRGARARKAASAA